MTSAQFSGKEFSRELKARDLNKGFAGGRILLRERDIEQNGRLMCRLQHGPGNSDAPLPIVSFCAATVGKTLKRLPQIGHSTA